ncbi:MAG: hypothetical protein JJT95_10980 [Pararhodobacter sp.]|nr:hypothetical protein [Pararhodobacter sp.]
MRKSIALFTVASLLAGGAFAAETAAQADAALQLKEPAAEKQLTNELAGYDEAEQFEGKQPGKQAAAVDGDGVVLEPVTDK